MSNMVHQSRRRLPLLSLDNNNPPSRRSKRLKTVEESDSDDEEVLEGVNNEATTSEAPEATSNAGGASEMMAGHDLDGATDAAEATDEAEAPNEAEQEAVDNEDPFNEHAQIPSNMNLRCMKAINQHFPTLRGKGKMQPTPTFQMDIFLLQ